MKTFEEKFTAWLDDQLRGEELRSFEIEYPPAQLEKAEFLKLKTLLRDGFHRRELENPEFFNSQIMARIEREADEASRSPRRVFLGLPRLAWGGVFALGVGFAMFFAMIPRGDLSDPRAGYVADVLKTRTADPKVKATVENQKDMTIIKLEGLDKLPPGQELKH
jgi:anti-sigma factor RsiW